MNAIFDKEPNHKRAIMLLAGEWAKECGRSMALQFAWHEYRAWKAAKEAREEAARAEFFRTYKDQREAARWKALREQAGKLPVIAVERREGNRPIMGRKQKGEAIEFYRCRSAVDVATDRASA